MKAFYTTQGENTYDERRCLCTILIATSSKDSFIEFTCGVPVAQRPTSNGCFLQGFHKIQGKWHYWFY